MIYDNYSDLNEEVAFNAAEAKTLMLRPGSKLRTITFENVSYSVSGYFGQRFFPLHLAFFLSCRENGCMLHLSETLVHKLRMVLPLKWSTRNIDICSTLARRLL